jgi:hypothetical protein
LSVTPRAASRSTINPATEAGALSSPTTASEAPVDEPAANGRYGGRQVETIGYKVEGLRFKAEARLKVECSRFKTSDFSLA